MGKARAKTGKGFFCTPTPTKNYETLVKELFFHKYGSIMLMGNIKATITAYFGLNKEDYGKKGLNKKGLDKLSGAIRPTKKPDIDNIEKIILDSLNGIAYKDDSQVVESNTSKHYAEKPRVEVVLERL